ncbi:MAG: hypothetical protein M3345_05315 [Actinomycetota bacterium]|nr:hypothetical protein [Actinomycetota bacterium]
MTDIKAGFGLLLAVVVAGTFGLASCASDGSEDRSEGSDRNGTLSVDKECPPDQYTGKEGSYCTFTSSSLDAASADSKVIYLQPEDVASDVILEPPGSGDDQAFGRCVLPDGLNGLCTFNGGTGEFKDFSARLTVTHLGDVNWHWEGPYSFSPLD